MMVTQGQVALEVQRIEGAIKPGFGTTGIRWRWIAGRRYRVEATDDQYTNVYDHRR